jgi:NADP-dependent 3-hydroxy acid dehydrogenase YdfG
VLDLKVIQITPLYRIIKEIDPLFFSLNPLDQTTKHGTFSHGRKKSMVGDRLFFWFRPFPGGKNSASGDCLLATARNTNQLQDLKGSYPETCWILPLDVTEEGAIQQTVQHALQLAQRIDVLVNNAGYGLLGSLEECSQEQIRRNFEVNFFGAANMIRHVLPTMREQKKGHIINMSAAAAIANYAGFSIYGATKFALEGLSESLASEVKPLGVKVTLIEPGPFRTDFIARSMEKVASHIPAYDATVGKFGAFLEKMEGQQPGDPAKAAEAILQVVNSETPPLRLVLGKYAIDKVERVTKSRLRELETWKEKGLKTDF